MLFLHGYLSRKESFSYQIPFFADKFDVHAIDLKGFGENTGMDYPYSLKDYANEVKKYITDNGIENTDVIAHSFGARIVIKLLESEKGLFDKIVLTGAAGCKPKRGIKYRTKKILFKTLKPFVPKKRLAKFYSKDYLSLSPVMQKSFVKIVNEHLDDKLKYVDRPTLLIFGDKDRETPLYMAKKMNSEIKGSTLSVYKGAGHFPFIDKPYKFNTEVREFLLSK